MSLEKHFRKRSRIYRNYLLWSIANKFPPGRVKNWLIRRMGADIGKDVYISPWAIIDPVFPEFVHIEDGVFLGWNARIFSHIITPYRSSTFNKYLNLHNEGKLEILKVVILRPGNRKYIFAAGHIYIRKYAFIGGFTTVRAGVEIGEGAIIGSDSLVTKDISPYTIAVGIPAKEKERFPTFSGNQDEV